MELKPVHITRLKNHITADPVLGPLTSGPGTDYEAIVAAMNAEADPVTKAWRTAVDPKDTDGATPWANFDGITQAGKRDSFLHAFLRYPRDYSVRATRKWIADVWGNASVGSDAAAILNGAGVENATRAEVVINNGAAAVAQNSVSAINRPWVGQLTIADIAGMFNQQRVGQ